MSPEHTKAIAASLRSLATRFEGEDWEYTRDIGDLRPIRYGSRWAGVKSALLTLASSDRSASALRKAIGVGRWRVALAHLKADGRRPDGVLDNGSIITHWEEHGEYLQLVQPAVGEIVAEIMTEHHDLALVQALAGEIMRIQGRYAAGLVQSGELPPIEEYEAR